MKAYNGWELIPWDGNPAMNIMCWRKQFGRGHVSVGCGTYLNITYSYGANSDKSYSGTRWRPLGDHITEREAMDLIDEHGGESTGSAYEKYIEDNDLSEWDPCKHRNAPEWREWVKGGSKPVYGYRLWKSPGRLGVDTIGEDTGYQTSELARIAGDIARERWLCRNSKKKIRGKVLKDGSLYQFFGDHR